jgi:hypothetical protein
LEDMLRACVLDFKGSWSQYIPLIEFAYNNSYQASIKIAPYEALYERRFRSPLYWDEVGERQLTGPELIQETAEKITLIRQRLTDAQNRQKSYADHRRRDLEFTNGDKVFLKVAPMKGVTRFGKRGKLNPRYIGPYEILDRVGPLAYRLALPPHLSGVHNVFHVSTLRKYVADPSHVLEAETIPLRENLSYEEIPMKIIDKKENELRRRRISMVKVMWSNHQSPEEASWELEETMHDKYPHLFA